MRKLKIWLLFLGVTVLAYGSSVFYGFSQDDFFHLVISRAGSLKDFLNFFIPHPESWVFYRPLSTQLWYWLFETVFGWQRAPLPMHLAALLLHATNAYLVSLLVRKVFKLTARTALLAGSLYAASSVHFLSLFYLGATQQLLTTFFGLLAVLANLENKRVREITFFLLSLLSKELAVRLVPILFLLRLLRGDGWRTALSKSLPLLLVSVIYLAVRYLSGIATPPEYRFDFSPTTTIATMMWYGLMLLGAPEQILRYGLSAGRIDFPGFISDHPVLGTANLLAIALLIGLIIIVKKPKGFIVYPVLWLAALAPILFLPTHRYAHYLDLSLIPLLALLLSSSRRWLLSTAVAAFLVASVSGQLIDRETHWTLKRAALAAQYNDKLSGSQACSEDQLSFNLPVLEAKELSYALMNENGPRIICNNPDLQVYYFLTQ